MERQLQKVREMMLAMEQTVNNKPTLTKRVEDYELRYRLGREELDEYLLACAEEDLIGIADSLGDQLVVLLGTIHAHGLSHLIIPVFDEIMRANMSKLDENGKPIKREDGKFIKGPNYVAPNLYPILNASNLS